jgi:hypothetical protein
MRLLLISGAVVAHLLLRVGVLVQAYFGDYVDPSYNCPAQTTCPQICVAAVEECPTACEDAGLTLCADGSCQAECGDDLKSPCEFACASVACAKQVTAYNTCNDEYGPLYEAETACGAVETAEEVKLFKYIEAGFVVVYAWVTIVSVLILAWCLYKYVPKMCAVRTSKTIVILSHNRTTPRNTPPVFLFFSQKIAPVSGSARWMNMEDKNENTEGLQIGYKTHPVGMVLHGLTLITLAGWIALLAWLTIQVRGMIQCAPWLLILPNG